MTELIDHDRIFALTHTPPGRRDALAALWALDERLGAIVATTTQPLIGQMRLTWWHDALMSLNEKPVSGEPLLAELHAHGFDGAALVPMIEGWEVLLDAPVEEAALRLHSNERGAQMFALSAALLGGESCISAGCGWALADFARRCPDERTARQALDMAQNLLAGTQLRRLPRPLRILARLAAGDATARLRRPRTLFRLLAAAR